MEVVSLRTSVARGIVTLLGYDATENDPLYRIFAPHVPCCPASFVDPLLLQESMTVGKG